MQNGTPAHPEIPARDSHRDSRLRLWLLRLIGRTPVAHLGTPDDLATEQRIADLTRRLR